MGTDRSLVATDARLDSEAMLQDAIARNPEVIPNADLRLEPLVTLAIEINFGSGPIDLLAVDAHGRLVVVEFKKGTENRDVRKVVAQMLDYGSALWRASYDELEQKCDLAGRGYAVPLEQHVQERLETIGFDHFDTELFRTGVEGSLGSGAFVFLYVARNLDERTQRIFTYLAEGPRMSFFAVDVDYFPFADGSAVLVPRVAFVPSWVQEVGPTPAMPRRSIDALVEGASSDTKAMADRFEELRAEYNLRREDLLTQRVLRDGSTGLLYLSPIKDSVYFETRFFQTPGDPRAEGRRSRIVEARGGDVQGKWTPVPCGVLVQDWDRWKRDLIDPYLRALLDRRQDSSSTHVPEDRG